jgi:cytochrome c biogenesis protein CcmG, thiol:disulfide interchange protein DsbE
MTESPERTDPRGEPTEQQLLLDGDSAPRPGASGSSWRGPRIVALGIGLVTVVLVGVLATRQTAAERSTVSPLVGKVAPEITGNDILTGKRFQLSSEQGRWTLVNFFATWCPPCLREHPEIVAFAKANPDVDVLSVINEDSVENVRAFFAENGGNWPVLDNTRAAVDYGITGLPESYLIAPNGLVAVWFKGALTQSRLQQTLDASGGGVDAPPTTVSGQ